MINIQSTLLSIPTCKIVLSVAALNQFPAATGCGSTQRNGNLLLVSTGLLLRITDIDKLAREFFYIHTNPLKTAYEHSNKF
jgi:hypothetical protein